MVKCAKENMKNNASSTEIYDQMEDIFIEMDQSPDVRSLFAIGFIQFTYFKILKSIKFRLSEIVFIEDLTLVALCELISSCLNSSKLVDLSSSNIIEHLFGLMFPLTYSSDLKLPKNLKN